LNRKLSAKTIWHRYSMLRHLVLIPKGGLCNKMLAIACAKRLCKKVGALCTIVWDWADYRDLFDDREVEWISEVPTELLNSGYRIRHKFLKEGGNTSNRRVPLSTHNLVILTSSFIFNAEEEPTLAHEDAIDLRAWFPAPHTKVRQRMEDFAKSQPLSNAVGVHIRRTDNVRSIMGSPDSLYFHEIDTRIPDTRPLFLATDNDHTRMLMKQRYGDRIVEYLKNPRLVKRWPRRFSLSDTIDDLVDLHLLASCESVIGSAYSSFSKVAIMLNGSTTCQALVL